ncbi:hypothetical protein MMC17_010197 [Xylographa soralifera]|nr:hypothetical protein [Xylographa soralifera]
MSMERRASTQGHSGSYGHACMQCFQAKTRCVSRQDGRGCERCFRLKNECQPSDSVRRRIAHNNKESDTQIAKLESRIDALVSVMRGMSTDMHRVLGEQGISLASAAGAGGTSARAANSYTHKDTGPNSLTSSPSATSHSDGGFQPCSALYEPSADEAEHCLDLFQSRMLPCFPFIHIPPTLTARQMRRDLPFLFRAIVTVTSASTHQRLIRAEELRSLLAKSVIVEHQSNIDLLLGLLTYVAWNTEPFLNRGCTLSHLMMMAISLVYDLRLVKPVSHDAHLVTVMTQAGSGDVDSSTDDSPAQGFLDQQRAVLACFLLSSVISSHFGLIDALRWTPQIEEAVRIIETNKDCSTDEAFAFQVRLQLLAQKTAHVRERANEDRAHAAVDGPTASLPTLLYLNTLQERLRELRSSVSQAVQQQGELPQLLSTRSMPFMATGNVVANMPAPYVVDIPTSYAHYTELCINEAARPAGSNAPLLTMTVPGVYSSSSGTAPEFERLQCLWRCIGAIKSWLDVFYVIPPAACVGLPFFFWSQLVRCIMILKHLSTLEDPAWDCQAVLNTIDLMHVLDWIGKKVELASVEAGESSENDLFRQFSTIMRMSRAWIIAKRKAEPIVAERQMTSPTSDGVADVDFNMADPNQMAWIQSIDLGNDKWFEELFGWSSTTY